MTAAFFDLDNTLVRGSSLIPFAYAMVREGRISTSEVVRFAWMNARFVARRTESTGHRDQVLAKALSLVQGVPSQTVEDLCKRIVPGLVRTRTNTRVVAEVRGHRASGHQTWLVTASPVELAEAIAVTLGMTGALGTRARVRDGVYTGDLDGDVLHGPRKASAVSALAEERGLDLRACHAYSDSVNDLPLLTLVGHATVVNPNRELLRMARANDWRVIDSALAVPRRVSCEDPRARQAGAAPRR